MEKSRVTFWIEFVNISLLTKFHEMNFFLKVDIESWNLSIPKGGVLEMGKKSVNKLFSKNVPTRVIEYDDLENRGQRSPRLDFPGQKALFYA